VFARVVEALETVVRDAKTVVKSVVKKISFPDAVEDFGAPIFLLCDVHATETLRSGIDLDMQAFDAVISRMRGEPLEVAQGMIDERHRAAPIVRRALAELPAYS
jgi:hypothetical protein